MKIQRMVIIPTILIVFGGVISACALKNPFPLAESGEYQFGTRMNLSYSDPERNDRVVNVYLWYPAALPKGVESTRYNVDIPPDLSGAPYPVILSSAETGMYMGPHLATHGFVFIGVDLEQNHHTLSDYLVDFPIDHVFALKQIEVNPPEGMAGLIDPDRTGVMEYSLNVYNALVLSGAIMDQEFYLAQCARTRPSKSTLGTTWIEELCDPDFDWEGFYADAGPKISFNPAGTWKPVKEIQIKAFMPIVPQVESIFNSRSLSAVDSATLLINSIADEEYYSSQDAKTLFENLGSEEKSMLSIVDLCYMIMCDDEKVSMVSHFVVAFFGQTLQGKQDYAEYYSKEFISKHEGLVWEGIADD
jgi:predicted dienelactone hydrolase